MLIAQIKRTIAQFRMLSTGDRVVVAVSGGPDSVCLLGVLRDLAPEYHLVLHVAHLDHMVRGEESASEARFVEQLAKDLGMPSTIERIDVPRYCAERGLSTQAGARQVRYDFLDRVARGIAADRIAFGHTANDQAETLLMRLIRGSGISGLAGIPPKRERIIRPLIETTREQVLAYLKVNALDFVTDPSNRKPLYTRNRVRSEVIPVLERFNPRIVETLASTAARFRDEDATTDSRLHLILPTIMKREEHTVRIDQEAFLELPVSDRRRAVRTAVSSLCGNGSVLSRVRTEEAMEFLTTAQTGKSLDLSCGLVLTREYDAFLLSPRTDPKEFCIPLPVPGSSRIPALGIEVTTAVRDGMQNGAETGNYQWQAVFDYDKMCLPLYVRSRRPGDSLQPAGMEGKHKKLQDLFVDEKVPRSLRDRVPLLATERDILWVVGIRTDGRILPGIGTKKFLVVTITRSETGREPR
jgi:tRNA(Ile)-lysidine synthase